MADKKKKDKADEKSAGSADDVLRVAGHPRAARSVRTIKGWGGLAAFLLVFWLSYSSGVPFYWSALRAVLGGLIAYVVAWMCAVTFWRQLLVARVEVARIQAMAELDDQPQL